MDANFFLSLVQLVVGADVLAYPGLQGSVLQAKVEGDVRHAARVALGGAGFLVDLLWDEPKIQAVVQGAVRNEIARAQTQRAPGTVVLTSDSPLGGPVSVPAGSIATLPYVTFIDPPR